MPSHPLRKNKAWLYGEYIDKGKTTYQIARESGISESTICNWLHEHKIPPRRAGWPQNHLEISPYLQAMLEGELLGDGSIAIAWTNEDGYSSAKYTHGSKYKEYLIWLSGEFASQGLAQAGNIYECVYRPKSPEVGWKHSQYISYRYSTRAYPELIQFRERFYPDGKKIVPKDLTLNPINARQWYIGDGSLNRQRNVGKDSFSIQLATCGFDKYSVVHLMDQLSLQGIKTTYHRNNNTIRIRTSSTADFLDWIGPCPPEIENVYGYKWQMSQNK